MDTYFRLVKRDSEGDLLGFEIFSSREEAEAAANGDYVIDQGHFEGFSFVKD